MILGRVNMRREENQIDDRDRNVKAFNDVSRCIFEMSFKVFLDNLAMHQPVQQKGAQRAAFYYKVFLRSV